MKNQSFIFKLIRKSKKLLFDFFCKNRDLLFTTFSNSCITDNKKDFLNDKFMKSSFFPDVSKYLISMYLNHRFDLLGSGWVKNSYESNSLGVEDHKYYMNLDIHFFDGEGIWLENIINISNLSRSRKIWRMIDDQNYIPIDWQKDFKSGFRWNSKTWYRNTLNTIGKYPGVDIKVPWELARLQHLPQLAVFSFNNIKLRKKLIKEFRNQILDFISTNPPRFGVNWACTMDVGIRVVNMIVAYKMFLKIDDKNVLDNEFKKIFANSIYEHGFHIVNNLEYSDYLTSNHYLSNIAGLLFISAYFGNTKEVNTWLAFSIQEIIVETKKQFYEDGGNFESSTSYHRLSGELIVYSTALITGLSEEKIESLKNYDYKLWKKHPKLRLLLEQEYKVEKSIVFPQWFIDKLYKIGRFTVDITKPSGEIPQIGDNDSGRFLKISPNGKFITNKQAEEKYINLKGYNELVKQYNYDEKFWDENFLNHQSFIGVMSGIFDDPIFNSCFIMEQNLILALSNNKRLKWQDKKYSTLKFNSCKNCIKNSELIFTHESLYNPQKNNDKSFFENLKLFQYPESGIYIYKSDRIYLCICLTPLGQNNFGGHSHNDKLSFELTIDGKDIIKDPGTYLYTSDPEKRNVFRATSAHNIPIIDNFEQNEIRMGKKWLFFLKKQFSINIFNIGRNYFEILLLFNDVKIIRIFDIRNNYIKILDKSNKKITYSDFRLYSKGYGIVSKIR